MQRLREYLAILLLGLLPFHAFLVTFGTKVLMGAGHSPLTSLALWKEGVLGLILIIAAVEILKKRQWPKMDILDWLVQGMIALSVIVTALTHGDVTLYAFGFKYDFIPLVAFVVLRKVEWSKAFVETVLKTLLIVGLVVALLGIASLFLPMSVLISLGYSDLHSLYVPGGPLAAFQQIESLGIRRLQSTMSGPNQLGLWLLIPWSIALLRRRYAIAIIVFTAILLTFSRSAWIASGVIFLIVLWQSMPRKVFFSALGGLCGASLLAFIVLYSYAPGIIARGTSTLHHIERPLEAMRTITENPFGLGLGTAGPASNRVSDACAYYEEGSDLYWLPEDSPLCIFIGDEQVHPIDRTCRCPVLPENWYLQIGVEMGVLGLVLFMSFVLLLIVKLKPSPYALLPFVGVSIAALFLHAWEDSAVSLTLFLLGVFHLQTQQYPLE